MATYTRFESGFSTGRQAIVSNRGYSAARRLSVILYFPVMVLAFAFLLPTSIVTWIITGKDVEDQMDWLESKNDDYWSWVKQ